MADFDAANDVIKELKEAGHDYQKHQTEIAEFFDEYLYNGNWDCTLHFDGDTKSLRFIQEDEFDQHHSGDMPEFDEQVCFASGHYVFLVD